MIYVSSKKELCICVGYFFGTGEANQSLTYDEQALYITEIQSQLSAHDLFLFMIILGK